MRSFGDSPAAEPADFDFPAWSDCLLWLLAGWTQCAPLSLS